MDRTAGHIAALYDPSMGEMFCPVAGTIVTLMRKISQLVVADDGIAFAPASFASETVRERFALGNRIEFTLDVRTFELVEEM